MNMTERDSLIRIIESIPKLRTGDAGMANLGIWIEFYYALYAIHVAAAYQLEQIGPPTITAAAAAEIIGIDISTVYRLVKQGRLVLTKSDAERYRDKCARPGKKRGKPTPSQSPA